MTMVKEPDLRTIGGRLEYARNARGWNQARLATEAGVSPQLVSQIETGRNKESGKIPVLAMALGVSTDWLAAGKGPMERVQSSALDRDLLRRSIEEVLRALHSEHAELEPIEVANIVLDVYETVVNERGLTTEETDEKAVKMLIRHSIRVSNSKKPNE